jgi:hypothetical protein
VNLLIFSKIFKIYELFGKYKEIAVQNKKDNFLAFLKLLKLFFFAIMVAHLIACIFLALVYYNWNITTNWLLRYNIELLQAKWYL